MEGPPPSFTTICIFLLPVNRGGEGSNQLRNLCNFFIDLIPLNKQYLGMRWNQHRFIIVHPCRSTFTNYGSYHENAFIVQFMCGLMN